MSITLAAQKDEAAETLTFNAALTQAEAQARSTLSPTLHERLSCAVALVKAGKAFHADDHTWTVASTSTPGKVYTPNGTCGCDDTYYNKPRYCKHQLAMFLSQRVVTLMHQPPAPVVPEGVAPLALPAPAPYEGDQGGQAPPSHFPRRSIRAIVADLSQPLPPACVATKPSGGTRIRFLHWQTVARLLDTYAPGWHGYVVRIDQVAQKVVLTYRVTIPCAEGEVSREATGQEEEEVKGYGDSSSNAEAMSFKRAAAKFGVGAWLYDNDDGTSQALTSHLGGHGLS